MRLSPSPQVCVSNGGLERICPVDGTDETYVVVPAPCVYRLRISWQITIQTVQFLTKNDGARRLHVRRGDANHLFFLGRLRFRVKVGRHLPSSLPFTYRCHVSLA